MFTVSQILAPAPPPVTPTVDKTPPQIAEVAISSVTASSAMIEWTTNEKATSQVMLCDLSDVSGSCSYTDADASLMKDHSVAVDFKKLKVKLNTKYHITVMSMDTSGNQGTYEMEEAFTLGSQPPTTPPPATVPEGIEVGKRAFDFTLKNLQDANVSLRSHLGKVVMVNFWAVTCGPCVAELPYIEELYKARSGQLVVLAINEGETKATVQSFITSTNYTFPVLLDSGATARSIYNVTNWPQTFFIDSTGVIRNIKVGPFANKAEIETILSSMQ
jgi:peroxiredoxin